MAQDAAQLRAQLEAIRVRQQQIEEAIREVQKELKWAEAQPPLHQPYVTLRGGVDLRSMKGPPQTLQQLLRDRLLYLHQLLKALPRQAAAVRQAQAQQKANRAQTSFKNKVLELLKESEKQGYLNDADVRELTAEGEQALKGLIGVLDANPSPQNAIAVLDAVSGLMQLGWGSDGAADKAFQSLAKAAQKVYEQADRAFRRTPSAPNFQKLLQARQQLQFAGGTPKDRPDGWRPVGKSHTTQPGDTLSGLSQRYYGSPSYWDVIYLENLGIKDVNRLPPLVPLRIP